MVAKRVEKAIAPAAAGGKGQRQAPQQKHAEQRKRVGKLRAARHAGENPAAVGACLRKQRCLRSRVCLGEDPGNGLGGRGLPPAKGGAEGVSRKWGIGSGLQERLPRGRGRRKTRLGFAQAGGHGSFGGHRAGGLLQAKDGGRQVGHLTVEGQQHISQNAEGARDTALRKPRPPSWKGSCARRAAVSSKGAAPRRSDRQDNTASSCEAPKAAVKQGGSMRRTWPQRGAAQNQSSNQAHWRSGMVWMACNRLSCLARS